MSEIDEVREGYGLAALGGTVEPVLRWERDEPEVFIPADGWNRNTAVFRAEKIAAFLPITAEAFIDVRGGFITNWLDRMMSPWKYADRSAMPTIEIFPRLTRWQRRARTVRRFPRVARQRLRDVADVARHGMPEIDEDRW